jgi:hypothetical protein
MRAMAVIIAPQSLDEDLAAAVLAALALYLEAEQQAASATRSAWQVAALVASQGIAPAAGIGQIGWANTDRAGRMGRWSAGMLGAFD